MKQPAAILLLPVLYTILVLPESSSICNTVTDTGQYQYPNIFQNFPVSAILEDTGHCQNMSIADTGRFWEILVIPVLQILEDSRKYWLYQYCRYWKILEHTGYTNIADTGRLFTKLRNVLVYWFFLPVRLLCLFSTQIFEILHKTFVYSDGGMDRQGYVFLFSRPLLLPLLFSPSFHSVSLLDEEY